jgi:hypothetical protein
VTRDADPRPGPRAVALGLLLALAIPAAVSAQAWLPTKGEGAVGLTFGDYGFDGHFDSQGERVPYGGTNGLSLAADVTYGVTDRFAVTASVPYVASKFTGTFPPGVLLGPLDRDRKYHGDFQDFRAELRYMVLTGDLAVTPFVGVNLPSHQYEVVGEAVPGKRTRELALGVAAGRSLEPLLDRAYVQARYFFSFVEQVVPEIGQLNRSNIDLELGYAATRRLTARVFSAWQIGHGGLDLEDMYSHPDLFRVHDRAIRTNYFNLGGGLTVQVTSRIELFGAYMKTISGKNAHQAQSLYFGAALWFGGGLGKGTAATAQASVRPSPESVSARQVAAAHH